MMAAYLATGVFALTAVVVVIALADCAIRFRNAWKIARRDLASIDADIAIEIQLSGSNVINLRRPACNHPFGHPSQTVSLPRTPGLPIMAGPASAAA